MDPSSRTTVVLRPQVLFFVYKRDVIDIMSTAILTRIIICCAPSWPSSRRLRRCPCPILACLLRRPRSRSTSRPEVALRVTFRAPWRWRPHPRRNRRDREVDLQSHRLQGGGGAGGRDDDGEGIVHVHVHCSTLAFPRL